MFTILKNLPLVLHVGEGSKDNGTLVLKCTNDDGSELTSHGIRQYLTFSNDYVYEGANITFSWQEADNTLHSLTFIFRVLPNLENEINTWQEYFPPRPMLDFGGYMDYLANTLTAHSRLGLFFNIKLFQSDLLECTLLVEANDRVKNFNISTTALSVNINAQIPYSPGNIPENYKIIYEIISSHKVISSGYGIPDSSGNVSINIKAVLKFLFLSQGLIPPNFNTLSLYTAYNNFKYSIRITEEFGSPVVRKNWLWQDNLKAVYTSEPTIWAMVCPNNKKINWEVPEYAAWANYSYKTQKIIIQTLYIDRDSETWQVSPNSIPINVGSSQTIMIPIQQVVNDNNAAIVRIRVIDADTTEPLSTWRQYYIDKYSHEEEKYLTFLNKYGVWESIRFTGSTGTASDVKRRDTSSYNGAFIITKTTDITLQRVWSFRTGFISKGESFAIEQLVSSYYIFEVNTEGYIQLRLTDTRYIPDDGQKEKFSWEIKATPVENLNIPTSYIKKW